MLTGGIAVIAEIDLRRIALQQTGLFIGERGTEGGADSFHPELGETDHIHIAFHENNPVQMTLLTKQIRRKNTFPFVENRRIGCIEVFRLPLFHGASTEGQYIAMGINDRKHRAAAEHVKVAVFAILGFFAHCQPGQNQLVELISFFEQAVAQYAPVIRGGTQAEFSDHAVA